MATASVKQRTQIGVETTPGTAQAPAWEPSSFDLTINPKHETMRIRPSGRYFDSTVVLSKTWTEGSADGVAVYGLDRVRVLDCAFGTATPTLVDGKQERVYTLKDTRPTWTIVHGDAATASRAVFCFVTGLSGEFGRNSGTSTMGVTVQGGYFEDGQALATTGVTAEDPNPQTALHVETFLDGTRIAGALSVSYDISDLRSGVHYLNASQKSHGGTVNAAPDATFELMVEANAAGRTLLASLRGNDTHVFTMTATDPDTGDSESWSVPVAVEDSGDRADTENVWTATYTLRFLELADDELTVTLRNEIA